MLLINDQDYYRCVKKSLIADYDFDTLTMLYQPIIGAKSLGLYYTFLTDANYHEWVEVSTHGDLVKRTGMSLFEIIDAEKKLEAIGLIKTYRKKEIDEVSSYVYEIYAPKTPNQFFLDPLFVGLLEASIGERAVQRMRRYFKINEINLKNYVNVSTKFNDVFSDVPLKLNVNREVLFDKNVNAIKSSFSSSKFLNILSEKYNISRDNVSSFDLLQIERLALLFNYKEDAMALFAKDNYYAEDNTFDIDNIYQKCKNSLLLPLDLSNKNSGYKVYTSDEVLAKKINLMNDTSPIEYFRLKNNNTYPSPSDINVINILSHDYKLNNGVINALIDYTLDACNQDFSKAYCEKLASKMARLKVSNALEAMNALEKRKKKVKVNVEEPTLKEENHEEESSIDELKKILESF